MRSNERAEMARNFIGVVTGLVVWLAITVVAGLVMRETWPNKLPQPTREQWR